jgi:hypothetical protein
MRTTVIGLEPVRRCRHLDLSLFQEMTIAERMRMCALGTLLIGSLVSIARNRLLNRRKREKIGFRSFKKGAHMSRLGFDCVYLFVAALLSI